ncbi:MAG: cell division protein FtsA [bacterium]
MGGKKRSSGEKHGDILVGLDLGATKTSVLIAELEEGALRIIGMGMSPAVGMKHGVVVNIEDTVTSIVQAVEAAERMADVQIESAFASIAGDHIRSVNSKGMIAVGRFRNGGGNKISRDDIQRVIETAKTISLPSDREILHVIPQDFLVDDRDGFRDPLGIVGTRLEANVHIITAALASAQTIYHCLDQAGIELEDLVLQPLASNLAVLSPDDRELGVALVNIGGGTSDLAVFYDGSIRYTSVVNLGGENVTRDLAHGLRLPKNEAEQLKLSHGCAHAALISDNTPVRIFGYANHSDRQVAPDVICAVIQPRMEEIYAALLKELHLSECYHRLTAGMVLTGGASLIPGAVELAEEIFNMPVRLGRPAGIEGMKELVHSPVYSTNIGLLLYGRQQYGAVNQARSKKTKQRHRQLRLQETRFQGFKRWLADVF